MFGAKAGNKVWFEGAGGRKDRELTIDKVGRRWITFVEDPHSHADRDTDGVYERKTGELHYRGKIWASEGLYRSRKRLEAQWMNLCSALGCVKYRVPRGMTIERIFKAREILGMEPDPDKTERETFTEVK